MDRFLGAAGHHLFLAYQDEEPVGFVSAIEMTHPDKGTEMFVYELAVADHAQRQGIGKALLTAVEGQARAQGCYGM